MIVTYNLNDKYSAAISGGGVVCYQLPRAAAAAAICEALGVTLAEANRLLDNPASPAEWRATFSSAVAADLSGLNDDVEAIADRERADKLSARIATLGEMLAEIHAQQAEANRLTAEANQLERSRVASAAAEATRVSQQQIAAKQAAAAREDATKWLDLRVVQDGDEIIIWRDVREFTHTVGPQREPQFLNYSVRVTSYPVSQCPPEVVARIGKPVTRSKVYIPDEAL